VGCKEYEGYEGYEELAKLERRSVHWRDEEWRHYGESAMLEGLVTPEERSAQEPNQRPQRDERCGCEEYGDEEYGCEEYDCEEYGCEECGE
jgi:hypothetical protein